ncbi:hypothetical protein NM208_g2299 [Fusarium decemcellulare]|uniref:Uncharacterized protein n=1 Tax=Fusarium decemcellulare TaxID=57161 RepID=A0ACC1ST44_9HYPO|nr:hypothetical protein NM208_g2299 [Fusarium decemcellulare]
MLAFNHSVDLRPSTTLKIDLETQGIILQDGCGDDSSGTISGRIHLALDNATRVERLEAGTRLLVRHKRPRRKACSSCIDKQTELNRCTIISEPRTLAQGKHSFDVSFTIPSQLPASMDNPLVAVEYELDAQVSLSEGAPIVSKRPFGVQRLRKAEDDRGVHHYDFNSSKIKTTLSLNRVVSPGGSNMVHIRLDNIASRTDVGFEVWKLKKVTWMVEEAVSMAFPTRSRKSIASNHDEDSQEVKHHSETHVLGEKTYTQGWREEEDGSGSYATFDFDYNLSITGLEGYACDEQVGPHVNHALKIELLLEKHFVVPENPWVVSPARAATTLRMTRPIVVADILEASEAYLMAPPAYNSYEERPPVYAT